MDNIESELSPVIYTRRSRFLDEELDETKDIITSTGGHCIDSIGIIPPKSSPSLYGDNKTDYEKYREVNLTEQIGGGGGSVILPLSAVAAASAASDKRKDLLSGSSMSISTTNNDHNSPAIILDATGNTSSILLGAGGGGGKLQLNRLDKLESETTISSRNANKSCTQSSSISSEPDIQESALLRRQQLTRVAEWVQNNHLDNIIGGPISSQSASSSMDAGSIDSGYKTKVNNNNCSNDLMLLVTPQTHQQNDIIVANYDNATTLSNKHQVIISSLSDDNKLVGNSVVGDGVTFEGGNNFAQNINNNNFIQAVVDKRFVDTISNGNNIYNEGQNENFGSSGVAVGGGSEAQIDFAQMEYNVKQFLLKQNEWSINSSNNKRDVDSCTLIAPNTTPISATTATTAVTTTIPKKNPHRTETNL